ncbi:malate dehydrogenase [Plasmodiophora brassicae]|uniref:Malate dehydrogenase n=1 Tax=Plasmodiophora brassicae TaxID=37360 RepID=A0A0G4IZV7_PLABS|nr:hypothetical protein PBRA_008172 [Plasmodiophora brassicae]SPR01987.1 unnamed protein product [Plasmodiophora brassicae]
MTGSSPAMRVLITGAAGQIGYSLIPLIASGQALGASQPIDLVLLDIPPAAKTLSGVAMEVDDCAYPLVVSCTATTDPAEAYAGVQVAILVGGFPRGPGMERKDLLAKNKPIFQAAGEALNAHADPDCKVVVVANPANTNCLIAAQAAPRLPKANFTALTRLDMNRAAAQIAARVGCNAARVRNCVIWGNHSKTQVPDALHATVDGHKSVQAAIGSDTWLLGDFMTTVQNRGADVIAARGLSSAMSAANAIKDHLRSWLVGTDADEFVSMGVYTTANAPYGIRPGIVFSYPVKCTKGTYQIVTGLPLHDKVAKAIQATEAELAEEKAEAGLQ